METINGKHFIAQPAIEKHRILYSFRFGGGVKGGTVKSGDVIRVIDTATDIDTENCSTDKLLHKISKQSLLNKDFFIQID